MFKFLYTISEKDNYFPEVIICYDLLFCAWQFMPFSLIYLIISFSIYYLKCPLTWGCQEIKSEERRRGLKEYGMNCYAKKPLD